MASILTKNQRRQFKATWKEGRQEMTLTATVRFDDECGNGHNTFSITGELFEGGRWAAGGCLHEEIAERFPELAPFIKWHLCSTDGPLHYLQNTVYLAGDKDCWGRRKGEPSAWEYFVRFNGSPITHRTRSRKWFEFLKAHAGKRLRIVEHQHREAGTAGKYQFGPKFTFKGSGATAWHECHFDDRAEAMEWREALEHCTTEFGEVATAFSEGKERELDAARRAAIWPEATDAELTAPNLKELLEARLPKLLEELRAAVESLGFTY